MPVPRDVVDVIADQWADVRPDLDSTPIGVVGRVSRLSRLIDRHLAENFAAHDIEAWMYDVLATLRRQGAPYRLTAGQLVGRTMVTTGAITNRIDRLEQRSLVRRTADPGDRRRVFVELTEAGLDLVDRVAPDHLDVEREILSALSPAETKRLAATLRRLLVALGDTDDSLGG